jgi:hypothetical protein
MPRMRKYGESKTTGIVTAAVCHVTSTSGFRKFQANRFLFDGVGTPNSVLTTDMFQCSVVENIIN